MINWSSEPDNDVDVVLVRVEGCAGATGAAINAACSTAAAGTEVTSLIKHIQYNLLTIYRSSKMYINVYKFVFVSQVYLQQTPASHKGISVKNNFYFYVLDFCVPMWKRHK
jgi:hypothetical protein